ncbi:hypothetical protein Hanom_Chr03g00222271 [Helianthus anomalus]
MNNLVLEAKTKCFWDPEIMVACKQWDETLRNNPICVPFDFIEEPEAAPSDGHQQHENAAAEVQEPGTAPSHQQLENAPSEINHEDTTNEESRQNEEAQQVISNFLEQMASEGAISKLTHAILCKTEFHIHMRFHAYT